MRQWFQTFQWYLLNYDNLSLYLTLHSDRDNFLANIFYFDNDMKHRSPFLTMIFLK